MIDRARNSAISSGSGGKPIRSNVDAPDQGTAVCPSNGLKTGRAAPRRDEAIDWSLRPSVRIWRRLASLDLLKCPVRLVRFTRG